MSIPWKAKLLISTYTQIRDAAFRPNNTVNRRLLNLLDFKTPPSPPSSFDHHLDPSRDLWFRLHTPSSSFVANLPVLVYFHGGGFVTNSPDSFFIDSFASRVANHLPSIIVSVNYRLAPEHRFPAQYEDGFDVVKYLDSMESRNILPPYADLQRCFIIGDSAGGNLGHHVVTRACEFQHVKLRGLISLQPFFGGEERTKSELHIGNKGMGLTVDRADWYWKAFLPIGSDRDHPSVNIFGPNSTGVLGLGFPDTLVAVGGCDPLQDWQERYCEGLRSAGVGVRLMEYPNAFHGFYAIPDLQESSLILDEIKDFVTQQLKDS